MGISDKEIKLYGSKLKAKAKKHGFGFKAVKDLPRAIQDPIAIFKNIDRNGNYSILTELNINGNNVLVAIDLGKDRDIDFNLVSSVFGKANTGVVSWINNNKGLYFNKEKALNYIGTSTPIVDAVHSKELNTATKVIENFENPKLGSDDVRFSLKSVDYDKVDLDHPFINTNKEITKDNLKKHKLKVYKISGGVSNHTYFGGEELFTDPNEAVEEASKFDHWNFNSDDEVEDISVVVSEYETDYNLYDIAEEGGYLDEDGNLDEDYDVDDIIEYAQDQTYDSTGEEHYIKTLMGKGTAEKIELEQLEEEARAIKAGINNEIQEGLKDYIHHQEEGGYMGASSYYYFVRDAEGNLVKNTDKRFGLKEKKAYFDEDRGYDRYRREYEKKNESDKILQVRVSNHSGNNRNTTDLVDGYLSFGVESRLLSPYSQEGFENPDKAFSTGFDEFGSNEDVRVTPDEDSVNPTARDIKEWLENTDAEWDMESGLRFSKAITSEQLRIASEEFNGDLDRLINGTLPKGYIFQLGRPMGILQSVGMPNLPIELSADRLKRKSEQENHPFDLTNIVNLPQAIQEPIMVFDSKTVSATNVVLTELSDGEKNFVVVLRVSHKGAGRNNIQVNDIKSLYPKDGKQIIKWIEQGDLLKYVNKEKATEFISVQSTNLIGNGNKNSNFSIAKIIENFENPKLQNDDIRFSIIGEKGAKELDRAEERVHRMDNLQVAREMENSNKGVKAIRLATGWERGADGRWRYEILDGKLKNEIRIKEVQSNSKFNHAVVDSVDYEINDEGTFRVRLRGKGAKSNVIYFWY